MHGNWDNNNDASKFFLKIIDSMMYYGKGYLIKSMLI